MNENSLSYMEKLENVFVLLETKQMLENKLHSIEAGTREYQLIKADIRKMEEDLLEYTGRKEMNIEQTTIPSLFNPALLDDES